MYVGLQLICFQNLQTPDLQWVSVRQLRVWKKGAINKFFNN
jgi:hypothetical protein